MIFDLLKKNLKVNITPEIFYVEASLLHTNKIDGCKFIASQTNVSIIKQFSF